MPRPTPALPFDPALIYAAGAAPPPGAFGAPPVVLGGVLRGDSPFLDAAPLAAPDDAGDDDAELDADEEALEDARLYMPLIAVAPEPAEPEAPPGSPAPFDRDAVERARARAARPADRVEATVSTDDGVAEHVCDVSAWLAGATRREVEALAAAGWSGDEAREVAAALAEDDPEVADVLRHARRTDADVSAEIDGRAALAWLARHRPEVAAALDGDAEEDAAE